MKTNLGHIRINVSDTQKLLKKIESRLESLEKTMNNKRKDIEVHNDSN